MADVYSPCWKASIKYVKIQTGMTLLSAMPCLVNVAKTQRDANAVNYM